MQGSPASKANAMSHVAGARPASPGSHSRLPAWAWPLLALPLVAGIGVWTYTTIAAAIRARLEGTLQTLLASDVSALEHWLEAEANVATLMTQDPRVREEVKTLIALARQTGGDPAALKAAPAQAAPARHPDPGGVAAGGRRLLRARSRAGSSWPASSTSAWAIARCFTVADATARGPRRGSPSFLPPTLKQRFAAVPMAFLMVPVREPDGRASAVMAFRILPQRLAAMLNASRLGESGETYAVDADGRMLTESRFTDEVRGPGPAAPGSGGVAPPPPSRFAIPAWRLVPGQAQATPPEDLAADLGRGRGGGRPRRRERGRLPRLPRRPRGGGLAMAARLGHRRRDRDGSGRSLRDAAPWSAAAFALLGGGLLLVAAAIALSSRRIYGLQRDVERAAAARAVHAGRQDRRGRAWAPSTGPATRSCGGRPRSS